MENDKREIMTRLLAACMSETTRWSNLNYSPKEDLTREQKREQIVDYIEEWANRIIERASK